MSPLPSSAYCGDTQEYVLSIANQKQIATQHKGRLQADNNVRRILFNGCQSA